VLTKSCSKNRFQDQQVNLALLVLKVNKRLIIRKKGFQVLQKCMRTT